MKFTSSYEPDKFESDIYAAWESSGAFNPLAPESLGGRAGIKNPGASESCYSIVMPPPNANGNLHIGHGLTIALEDSLTRYHRLKGNRTWYIPGADHAGFETWVVYERALEAVGHTRFEYSRDELYAKVWDFVQEQRGNMELQVRALGASCSWDDLTFTLDENVVARVYDTFQKMWNDGMIYRGEKLVNYCPKHQTAFADIEVEHVDEPGHLWDIKYEVVEKTSESSPEHNKENPQVFRDDLKGEQSVAGATRTALRANLSVVEKNMTGFSRARENDSDSSITYDTDSMGEDWICRELNDLQFQIERDMREYRFAEAVEALYSTIWDKYADWFLESQKLFKNLPLLKRTLEDLLIMSHPFMPFVTETIWQALSWTDGMIINQKWRESLKFDPISAENFERLMLTVSEARKVLAGLKDTVKGISVGLLYGDDGLVKENAELIKQLTHVDFIKPTDGTPRGIRLALSGREVYLDVPADIVKTYKDQLTDRILSVGRELDALNARMMNPNYVKKAPQNLVEETKKGIEEKKSLIERLKQELSVIE